MTVLKKKKTYEQTVIEDGDVEENTNATSARDGEIEDGMEIGPLPEVHQSIMDDADLVDFDLNKITNYSHEEGFLTFTCDLKSGKILPVPFEQLKQDPQHETSKCIKEMVISRSRGDCHQKWASGHSPQRKMSTFEE